MRLSLKAGRPLDDEVRRVASGYLERAKAVLTEQPDGPHEAIHVARKQFKRIRSLYRLVATADRAFQKEENTRIGALGRHLRESRDATSLVETARRLADAAATTDEHMAVNRVCQRLTVRRDAIAGTAATEELINDAITTCDEALAHLARLKLDVGQRRAAVVLGDGWRATGKKAVAALHQAKNTGEPDSFHSLRKRAQDRWVHCRFLADAWPTALGAIRTQARQLVTLLGENQDIALLTSFADAHPEEIGPPQDLAHLIAVMIAEGNRLRVEALPLAERVFPRDFKKDAARIALLWRHAD